jgi:hypothetical protein
VPGKDAPPPYQPPEPALNALTPGEPSTSVTLPSSACPTNGLQNLSRATLGTASRPPPRTAHVPQEDPPSEPTPNLGGLNEGQPWEPPSITITYPWSRPYRRHVYQNSNSSDYSEYSYDRGSSEEGGVTLYCYDKT